MSCLLPGVAAAPVGHRQARMRLEEGLGDIVVREAAGGRDPADGRLSRVGPDKGGHWEVT